MVVIWTFPSKPKSPLKGSMTASSLGGDLLALSLTEQAASAFATLLANGRVPPIDFALPPVLGNAIVEALRRLELLNERSLKELSDQKIHVTKIDLSGCGHFPYAVLSLLSKHALESLSIADADPLNCHTTSLDLNVFIRECINYDSYRSLRHLNINGTERISGLKTLCRFSSLECLSLVGRPLNSTHLDTICHVLPNLKMLDISETQITDISALSALKNIEILMMHNLKILSGDVPQTLSKLAHLTYLDVSKLFNEHANESSQESSMDIPVCLIEALSSSETTPWPELRALDISGNSPAGMGLDQAVEILRQLIEAHPKLEKISVMATPLDSKTYAVAPNRNVKVINCATRADAIAALLEYSNRDRGAFTGHALHAVYYMLQSGYDEFSSDEVHECVRLVCEAMKRHVKNLGVQMAGSACLYHLCKMKRIRELSSREVQTCMDRCLDAAENYQYMTQLQKNVWLTICNDYLLQLSTVDFNRTCKVALESMLNNRDSSVARMTIAIVSIVTPRMRPEDAQVIMSDHRYVRHLGALMKLHTDYFRTATGERADNHLYTLKFTLSAMWNLTDESPSTCEVFVENDGLASCYEILNVFAGHFNIETKVLGILNNVAEIDSLKSLLINGPNDPGLEALYKCLKGSFTQQDEAGRYRAVERSYFAAGVLANLIQLDVLSAEQKEEISIRMVKTIQDWPVLPNAMVSYKTFTPFVRILQRTNYAGPRMWCLWGVLHVLGHGEKSKRYFDMLLTSPLVTFCIQLLKEKSLEPTLRQLAERIEMAWLTMCVDRRLKPFSSADFTDEAVLVDSIPQI